MLRDFQSVEKLLLSPVLVVSTLQDPKEEISDLAGEESCGRRMQITSQPLLHALLL